jgi:predicted transcriptional regulator
MRLNNDQSRSNVDAMTDQPSVNRPMERRLTVHEAAEVLGITPEAVRGRIQRGTLHKEKGEDGSVFVRLNADQMQSTADKTVDESQLTANEPSDESLLIEALRERIEHLSRIIETRDEEIRRRDTILLSLTQRLPELELAAEPRETPETATPEAQGVETPLAEKTRSWWRRFFDL